MEWNKKTTLRETKKFLHVDFEQDKARDDQKGINFLIIIVNSINNKTVIVELYRFFSYSTLQRKKNVEWTSTAFNLLNCPTCLALVHEWNQDTVRIDNAMNFKFWTFLFFERERSKKQAEKNLHITLESTEMSTNEFQ